MTDESAASYRQRLILSGQLVASVQTYAEGDRPFLSGDALIRYKARLYKLGVWTPVEAKRVAA